MKEKLLRKALIYFVILVVFIGAVYLVVEGKLSIDVISFGFIGLVVLFVIILPLFKALRNKKTKIRSHQQAEETYAGLTENVAGLLCYVLGWISGLVFILAERENKFIRFHAMQSIIVFGALNIVCLVLGLIGVLQRMPVLWFSSWLISVIGMMLWMVLMLKAYEGKKFKLPWLGNIAEKWAG